MASTWIYVVVGGESWSILNALGDKLIMMIKKHQKYWSSTLPSTPTQSKGRSLTNRKSCASHKSLPNCHSPPRDHFAKPTQKKSHRAVKTGSRPFSTQQEKKVKEQTEVMKSVGPVCEDHRETHGTVLSNNTKGNHAAQDDVEALRKSFPKNLWMKRIDCMRVPD